ncbi:hypothetical protein [Anaerovorax sp. IOR16]|uniref:hypothetical protein n=1 Tax=Anaerovorax sp. IOR16 TaxID=2773458 RepID=UPI0019CFBE66|nr:hypothetical protein [Anaerovorax sp. IOR16]
MKFQNYDVDFSKKNILRMLLVIFIVLILFLWLNGFFQTRAAFRDVCSFSSVELLDSSEHWSFYLPKEIDYNAYLTFDGEENVGLHCVGCIYLEAENGESVRVEIQSVTKQDRHFYFLEKRWFLYNATNIPLDKVLKYHIRLQWESTKEWVHEFDPQSNNVQTEWISSGDLTPAEMEETLAFIESDPYDRFSRCSDLPFW